MEIVQHYVSYNMLASIVDAGRPSGHRHAVVAVDDPCCCRMLPV